MSQSTVTDIKQVFREADEKRAPLHLIHKNFLGRNIDLYIGNKQAASDPELLSQHGIGTVFNCAVNLDINLVTTQDPLSKVLPFGWSPVRYYKLGIVDGPGNPHPMMLAGYYQLRSLIDQELPNKPSYPWKETGNILINCRGGRSRSVTLTALLLHLDEAETYPSLEDAIAHIREARQLIKEEWPEAPKQVLVDAAHWAAEQVKRLQPYLPKEKV
ncbi:dual specificity protein phosphatase family protein [Marinomonas aquiplantarum]|uniref:Protein-tyrosine phosphatase n=1 Tax=Marinomonas aquiplantarum TaxID=491951 RepID=A0A366CSV4_9GAMM|nr:dual specificity protein phosphatase [Marinomonas aquiplantarum]RBO78449.1 protein-tyrosine phosphatase [Marinomonas aquiplantarum]